MISSPDVLYSVKSYEIHLDDEQNSGIVDVHFTLSGTRIMPIEEPQIVAPVVMEVDKANKLVYKLGNFSYDEANDVGEVLVGSSHSTSSDISQDSIPTFDVVTASQYSNCSHLPLTIAKLVGDDDEFAALRSDMDIAAVKPILEMDKPKIGAQQSLSHYRYDGFVKMHFDSNSLVYFNEFRMHNPEKSG